MAKKDSPLQAFFRLVIMTGTLSVGSLAAYQYGPPAEDLAKGINSAVSVVQERWDEYAGKESTSATTAGTLPAAPAAEPEAPRFDSAVMPAAFAEPVPPAAQATASTPAAAAPGATVEPWGNEGLHRASVSVPGPIGERHYDAIGDSPEQALERLAAEVNATRVR